jgi:signal transduction histidine kinase
MKLPTMNIFARIVSGYAVVMMGAIAAVTLFEMGRMNKEARDVSQADAPAFQQLSDLRKGVLIQRIALFRFVLSSKSQPGGDETLVAPFMQAGARLSDDLSRLDEYAANHPQLRGGLAKLRQQVDVWEVQAKEDIAAAQSGSRDVPLDDRDDNVQVDAVSATVDGLKEGFLDVFNHNTLDIEEVAAKAARIVAAIVLLAVLLTLLTGLQVARAISQPLRAITNVADRISRGDTVDPPELARRDEIGVLSSGLVRMVQSLRQLAEKERALSVDIAEYKRVQDELKRSNAELEQFASVASHDLQEPLRMVSSYMGLLKRRYQGRLDADADEFIGFAVDGVTRMQALINDLLSYSRAGREPTPSEPTDSAAALAKALRNLKSAIEEKGALISAGPLPQVMADPLQVSQLFQNLIANGIKFCRDRRPEISVGAERHGAEWTFFVRDNGIGIDPQYADRIFLIFQRLHKREEFAGTGIGLAICKKIVERHGGRIWLESTPGQGTTFYFTFQTAGGQQVAA